MVVFALLFVEQSVEAKNPWRFERKVDVVTDSVEVTLTNFGREWDGSSSKVNIGSITLRCKQGLNGSIVTLSIMSPKMWRRRKDDIEFFQESGLYLRFDKQKAVFYEGWKSISLVDVESLTCPDKDVAGILEELYSGDHRNLVVRSESPFTGQT